MPSFAGQRIEYRTGIPMPRIAPRSATVLVLEADPSAALAVVQTLADQMPEACVECVAQKGAYLERLAAGGVDLVISDGGVPGCEELEAFYLAREKDTQLGFVFLSDGEDPRRDVQGLAALGVGGFVPRHELDRLVPTVRAALDARERQAPEQPRLVHGYELLVGAVRDLSMAGDLPAIMAVVRRAARRMTGADGATFVLRDGGQCHYADEDAIGPLWKGQRFPADICVSGWAMRNRQPAVIPDIFQDDRVPTEVYEPTFVRSLAMVPIRSRAPIGAIGIYWSTLREPTNGEVQLLQALADTTSVAMENVRNLDVLEARVAERTADLESFISAVSHDLRAPIRHIDGFSALALRNQRHPLDDENRAYVEKVHSAATRMGEMITGLLHLSRTAAGDAQHRPVDLAAMATEVARHTSLGHRHHVEFVAPRSLAVSGDAGLLRVLLANLLENSWKFTRDTEGARVELGSETLNGQQRIFVKDNGAGFDPARKDRLFEVFQRLHRQDEFPGTGVGLALVRRIVEKHGGHIEADGAPGAGATFTFTLG